MVKFVNVLRMLVIVYEVMMGVVSVVVVNIFELYLLLVKCVLVCFMGCMVVMLMSVVMLIVFVSIFCMIWCIMCVFFVEVFFRCGDFV